MLTKIEYTYTHTSANHMEKEKVELIKLDPDSLKLSYSGDTSITAFNLYKKPDSPIKNVVSNVPPAVLQQVVPVLNSRLGYNLATVADHLGVSSKALSTFLKENKFSWSIEHRAYVPTDIFERYKANKLEKKISAVSKPKKFTDSKKVTIKLPRHVSNLLEIKKCVMSKSADEVVAKLLLESASQDELRIATNSSLEVKYKVVEEKEETLTD